jgi:hypothetical protein
MIQGEVTVHMHKNHAVSLFGRVSSVESGREKDKNKIGVKTEGVIGTFGERQCACLVPNVLI